jgi:hypothetical protein
VITVVTPARNVELTTLARVKAALGLTSDDATRDAQLQVWIEQASAAITDLIGYPISREEVTERLPGTGRTTVMLTRTPVVSLSEVTCDDEAVDLVEAVVRVIEPRVGTVYRETGWPDSRYIETAGITPSIVPMLGFQPYVFTYLGGYLFTPENITASGWTMASGVFSAPADVVVPLLASGELVRLRSFTSAANNGRFRVLARAAATLTLQGSFTDEAIPDDAVIEVATHPDALTIEGYALETVKAWYLGQAQNPNVQSESIGDWSATYVSPTSSSTGTSGSRLDVLPQKVLEAIESRWRREA